MKSIYMSAFAIVVFSSGSAFGMAQQLPGRSGESEVKKSAIYQSFYLATDQGSALVQADLWREASARPGSTEIPAPTREADTRLCKGEGEGSDGVNRFIKQTELLTSLLKISTSLRSAGYPKSLTAEDIKVLEKTPRCEPFHSYVASISALLDEQGPFHERLRLVEAQPKQVATVSLQKKGGTGQLILSLVNGQKASFNIGKKVTISRGGAPVGLSGLEVPSQTTGQNMGLAVDVLHVRHHAESTYTTREACESTERVTVCNEPYDRYGSPLRPQESRGCRDATVTTYGYREVRHNDSPSTTEYRLKLKDPNGGAVANFDFEIYDVDRRAPEYGVCIPESRDRRRY